MNQLLQPKIIFRAVRNERRVIQIGRSRNVAGAGSGTPIVIIPDSDDPPRLVGQPYLKTGFRNGRFRKILYTPSTLRITVGQDWNPYDNDNH